MNNSKKYQLLDEIGLLGRREKGQIQEVFFALQFYRLVKSALF
jgi:hypothetical protein